MFKDGSKVLGGEVTLDTEVKYVKLTSSDTASTFASGIINDNSSTVGAGTTRAQVVATINGIGSDPPTLIVKYYWFSYFLLVLQFILKGPRQPQQQSMPHYQQEVLL